MLLVCRKIAIFVLLFCYSGYQSNKNNKYRNYMANIKEPIRIRRKTLKNGNISLYLDIYRNGKRDYEFLKLYLLQGNCQYH